MDKFGVRFWEIVATFYIIVATFHVIVATSHQIVATFRLIVATIHIPSFFPNKKAASRKMREADKLSSS